MDSRLRGIRDAHDTAIGIFLRRDGPAALAIGLVAGIVCYGAVMLKVRFSYDDSLDVVGVHGVGGILGMLGTGLFTTIAVNPGGSNGLFYGNPKQLAIQALAVGVILVHSFAMTYGIFKFPEKAMGLRCRDGLDVYRARLVSEVTEERIDRVRDSAFRKG